MAILITGVAGFIGMHLARRLLEQGSDVIGIDSLSSYYDVNLKKDRLAVFWSYTNFCFIRLDLAENDSLYLEYALADRAESIHRMVQELP